MPALVIGISGDPRPAKLVHGPFVAGTVVSITVHDNGMRQGRCFGNQAPFVQAHLRGGVKPVFCHHSSGLLNVGVKHHGTVIPLSISV